MGDTKSWLYLSAKDHAVWFSEQTLDSEPERTGFSPGMVVFFLFVCVLR